MRGTASDATRALCKWLNSPCSQPTKVVGSTDAIELLPRRSRAPTWKHLLRNPWQSHPPSPVAASHPQSSLFHCLGDEILLESIRASANSARRRSHSSRGRYLWLSQWPSLLLPPPLHRCPPMPPDPSPTLPPFTRASATLVSGVVEERCNGHCVPSLARCRVACDGGSRFFGIQNCQSNLETAHLARISAGETVPFFLRRYFKWALQLALEEVFPGRSGTTFLHKREGRVCFWPALVGGDLENRFEMFFSGQWSSLIADAPMNDIRGRFHSTCQEE